MEYNIVIGLVALQMLTLGVTSQTEIKPLDDMVSTSDTLDEQINARIGRLQEYMHHKTIEHNRVLAKLLLVSQNNEALIKQLIKHCSPLLQRLKSSDKAEIFLPSRRNNAPNTNNNRVKNDGLEKEEMDTNSAKTVTEEEDTPIVSLIKFGRRMPQLGKLFLDIISNEFTY